MNQPKQIISKTETVTQAAYRLVPVKNISWDHNWNPTDANKKEREGFIKGANWQKEHSYSEQEQWISVEDKLPEIYSNVIIYGRYTADCPLSVYAADYNPKNKLFRCDYIKSKNVTHWMPLPNPPKQ